MDRSAEDIARAVLSRHGTTFAEDAGIELADSPAPLFQLLVLAELLSARIGAGIAVAAAVELTRARLDDPARRCATPGGPRSSPPSAGPATAATTSAPPRNCGTWPSSSWTGTAAICGVWPRRRTATSGRADRLIQEVKGIGPTGAAVFLREVQGVWPWVRPYLDDRARAGARRVGLPDDGDRLAELVPPDDLARFAAALVRVARLPSSHDPLGYLSRAVVS